MNKEFKKIINTADKCIKDVLESVNNNAEKCVEMLKKESPILVKEILRWELVSTLIPFVLLIMCSILFTIFSIQLRGWWYFLLIGSVLFSAFSFNFCGWLKVWVAPRLFLIEYVKKFIPKKPVDYN